MFQTISRNTQGGTANHIFNRLFRQLGSAEERFSVYEKNYKRPVHLSPQRYKPVDEFDEVVIRKKCRDLHPPLSASDHK